MSAVIVAAVFCVVLSFLASAWGNAVSRLTSARALRLQEEYPAKGVLLVRMAEDPRPYVTGVLLIMLLARVTAAVLVTSLLVNRGAPAAEWIAVVALTFVLFQLAELAPRTWVLERPDQVMLLAARPVYWLGRLLEPVSALMVSINKVFLLILPGKGMKRGPLTSEEEIKSIIDVAESEEVIEEEEREMIHSIFEFGDTIVREVMTPRPDMICVEDRSSLEDTQELMLSHGLSRMPVISESIDNVVGVLHLKEVVGRLKEGKRARRASEVAKPPAFVPENKKVGDLLREMRETKTHMMIVVDEYGGVAGLVTLEDLLEEIVGEISDEYDRDEPQMQKIDEETLRVDARLNIDALNEELEVELPHTEWDSVGGLVGGTLGRVARTGDVVNVDGVRFEVEKISGRRIASLLVHRLGAADRMHDERPDSGD